MCTRGFMTANMEPRDHIDDEWQKTAKILQKRYCNSYIGGAWIYVKRGNRNELAVKVQCALEGSGAEVVGVVVGDACPQKVANFCEIIYNKISVSSNFEFTVEFFYYPKNLQNHQDYPLLRVNSTKGHSFFLDVCGDVHKHLDFPSSGVLQKHTVTMKSLQRWVLLAELKSALFVKDEYNFARRFFIPIFDEDEYVIKFCDVIYDQFELIPSIAVSFPYVIGNVDGKYLHFPVINFRSIVNESGYSDDKNPSTPFFVLDHIGRVYKGWEFFEKDNQFPKCKLRYPVNGLYEFDGTGGVCVKFALSPACGVVRQTEEILNTAASVVMVGGFFAGPLTSTIILSLVALYEFYGACCKLIDRIKHGQSVSLKNPVGSECWVSVATNVALVGSGVFGAVAKTGLAAGSQLGVIVEEGAQHLMKASSALHAISKCNCILTNIKVPLEFCEKIFRMIKKQSINLLHKVIEVSAEMKVFLVGLWYKYFPKHQDCSQNTADCISGIMEKSEELGLKKGCMAEDEYSGFAHCAAICLSQILKHVQKSYEEGKLSMKKALGVFFDEVAHDEKFGITNSCDRDAALLKMAREEMTNINFESIYNDSLDEVKEYNNSGDLKFRTDVAAVNAFFRNVSVGEFSLTALEFFKIIRRVAGDNALIIAKVAHGSGLLVKYCDADVPVIVNVLELEGERFLEDCELRL